MQSSPNRIKMGVEFAEGVYAFKRNKRICFCCYYGGSHLPHSYVEGNHRKHSKEIKNRRKQ